MKITRQLFDVFIRCRFKLHLLATEQEGVTQQYGDWLLGQWRCDSHGGVLTS
jgi:hypothetical protein